MQDIDTADRRAAAQVRRAVTTVAAGRPVVVADQAHREEPSSAWPLPRS